MVGPCDRTDVFMLTRRKTTKSLLWSRVHLIISSPQIARQIDIERLINQPDWSVGPLAIATRVGLHPPPPPPPNQLSFSSLVRPIQRRRYLTEREREKWTQSAWLLCPRHLTTGGSHRPRGWSPTRSVPLSMLMCFSRAFTLYFCFCVFDLQRSSFVPAQCLHCLSNFERSSPLRTLRSFRRSSELSRVF